MSEAAIQIVTAIRKGKRLTSREVTEGAGMKGVDTEEGGDAWSSSVAVIVRLCPDMTRHVDGC